MKRIVSHIAIITMFVIFSASAFLAFQRLRNAHEANFAIQWGMAIAIASAPYPFTPESYHDFKIKAAKLIKEDSGIQAARAKAIRLGNTDGLTYLVAETVCKHFNIQPFGYPSLVQGPTPIATQIWNAWNVVYDLLGALAPIIWVAITLNYLLRYLGKAVRYIGKAAHNFLPFR